MSQSEAARVFQVSRTALHHWTKAVTEQGAKALQAKKRGRRHSSCLAPHEAAVSFINHVQAAAPDGTKRTVKNRITQLQRSNQYTE
ncbi:helix-turn-helix domain-containing protein [Phormidium tenue FACHB-886]|nr:helix-turn-helix domain-containing protein [Phormidium tenue FACHB-886]